MNIYKIQSRTQKLLVIDHLRVLLCFLTFLTYASCLCFPAQEHHRVICEALTKSLSNREMVLQGGRYVLQSCYVVLHVRYAEPLLWKAARGQKTKKLWGQKGLKQLLLLKKQKLLPLTSEPWPPAINPRHDDLRQSCQHRVPLQPELLRHRLGAWRAVAVGKVVLLTLMYWLLDPDIFVVYCVRVALHWSILTLGPDPFLL